MSPRQGLTLTTSGTRVSIGPCVPIRTSIALLVVETRIEIIGNISNRNAYNMAIIAQYHVNIQNLG